MKRRSALSLVIAATGFLLMLTAGNGLVRSADTSTDDAVAVGPQTEKRFPPLVIPKGFKATLFACDPLIEYPSVIAIGPRTGTLFVAHDYVTGLGVEIVRRDEIRLIEDSDNDGYADRSTLFAGGFNSIQGLEFHDAQVFVMHAPLLTRLKDTDGDGKADERVDLIKGLGLPPEDNSNRLHCANGVVAGHDGWLYLALGDRGCDVKRPEGDRLLFQQGGILRCRHDGTDLHVFSTGLRNIYDVALDDELNVFVRDNENDGGDYMIRVNHCFFGSDHGYPYHYYERPDEPMRPLADLGRGSSAGGTAYLEAAFPAEYQQSLFFCEWGRAVVRYHKTRKKSSFAAMTEVDFAAGADNDPYGFKPTDLVVDRDGSLLISDWGDGQRPKRGRGRIYRISFKGKTVDAQPVIDPQRALKETTRLLVPELNSKSYHRRVPAQLELQRRGRSVLPELQQAMKSRKLNREGRLHAVWLIARIGAPDVLKQLFAITKTEADGGVRAQAVRAIGDLTDPALNKDISEDDASRLAERVAGLAAESESPRVRLEALIVLQRYRWKGFPNWIAENDNLADPAIDHAIAQTLRKCGDWSGVDRLLDQSDRLRRLALHAMAEQRVPEIAATLMSRVNVATNHEHRKEYADALSRIVRKPEPWTYWGFRPAPRPAATVDWEQTPQIIAALNECLVDEDHGVRLVALQRMRREGVVPDLKRLDAWLREETASKRLTAIIDALKDRTPDEVRPLLTATIVQKSIPAANRIDALQTLVKQIEKKDSSLLPSLVGQLEDGPVLAAAFREFGRQKKYDIDELLLSRVDSKHAEVRAEAIRALAQRGHAPGSRHVAAGLDDSELIVKQAAAFAAGRLKVKESADTLLEYSAHEDRTLVRLSLESLRQLGDGRAIREAESALKSRETQGAAIEYLRDYGNVSQLDAVVQAAAVNPSFEFQRSVLETLLAWSRRFNDSRAEIDAAMAAVQGRTGQPLVWNVAGPFSASDAADLLREVREDDPEASIDELKRRSLAMLADANGLSIQPKDRENNDSQSLWLVWTPILMTNASEVEVLTSATGGLEIFRNRASIYHRAKPGSFRVDSDRFKTKFPSGLQLLVAKIDPPKDPARFQLRFRRRSSKAEHERLISLALQSRGNPGRGRDVFLNAEKSSCIRCHRMGPEGGRIGPDLSDIGRRFSRIHLIESILEPSRTVAPSYSSISVALSSGQVLSGVRVSETNDLLVLGDDKGKLHSIPKADIDDIAERKQSTMPEGLEKKLTDREFVDLLSFLESQTTRPVEGGGAGPSPQGR